MGERADITNAPFAERDRDAIIGLLNLITGGRGAEVLRFALGKPSRTVHVARDGARPVGVIILALAEWSGDAHIRFLAVDEAYRGRGIGAALVAWARDQATAAGMRRLYVDTSHDNVRGLIFYVRQGFIPEVCRFDFFAPGLHEIWLWMDLPYTGGERWGSGGAGSTETAMPPIAVSAYAERDRDAVVALVDAVTEVGAGGEILAAALQRDGVALVTRVDGATRGTLLMQMTRWNRTAHITILSVVPGHQGLGVGAALVARAKMLAHAEGLRRLTVGTGAMNWRAQLFYLRNGFIPEICRHDFGGPGVHELLLWQDLAP